MILLWSALRGSIIYPKVMHEPASGIFPLSRSTSRAAYLTYLSTCGWFAQYGCSISGHQ